MRKMSFRFRVFVLNGIVILLVVITGFFAYHRFTGIIAKLNDHQNSNSNILQVKSLLNDIAQAENYVKAFSITKDTAYLPLYYNAALACQKKWEVLATITLPSEEDNLLRDSLGALMIKKFEVLNNLLLLQDLFRVTEALNKVAIGIDESYLKNEGDEGRIIVKNNNNFLDRIFRKRKSSITKINSEIVEIDSRKNIIQKLNKQIEQVNKEERAIADSIREQELELIYADNKISDNIRQVMDQMKKREEERIATRAMEAKKSLEQTNFQIAVFFVVTGLLLILMTFNIVKYITYNNRYRKALKKAKAEAEDLALTKDKFFTNISHEIRTPMNAIVGFAELISQEPLNANQSEHLNMLRKSADHLLYLINDVLDLAKLDAGKLRLEATGFYHIKLFTETIDLLQPVAIENETELILVEDPSKNQDEVLIGDPYRLKQILLNIIGNAIKFTKKGKVTIHTKLENLNECTLLKIEVTDTGIGMSRKQLDKVFSEFEQADISISRTYGGSGLGLSIVYKLIKLHNGHIEIQSQQGVGTSVFIEIPYGIGTHSNVPNEKENSVSFFGLPQNLRILIADDEEYNRKLLFSILSKYKAICTEAINGQDVLKELKKGDYDIILMDSRMPKMSGVEAVRKIRKMENEKKDIPIIALTAAISDLDQKEYAEAGMQGFLPKPFKEKDLIKTIHLILNEGNALTFKEEIPYHNTVETKIDLTELKNLSRGDDSFYREMLYVFMDTTSNGIKKIKEGLEKEDPLMIANYAHKISAPCKHVGAIYLYNYLKKLEFDSRDGKDIKILLPMYELVLKEYVIVESFLKKELHNKEL